MDLRFELATPDDAVPLASLRTAVAEHLTHEHGPGHWSSAVSEEAVLKSFRGSRILVVREGPRIVATLRLATKSPGRST